MNLTKSHKFIISGGGTGGHIYPAIAIANEIKRREPKAQFLFVGAEDKMEMQKVPAAGYEIKGLWISGLSRKLSWELLKFPFKVMSSLWNSRKIIQNFKPDIVIGTGGFASGPILYMASQKKIPTLIQEQNSYPGITNKKLAQRAASICVAYEGLNKIFKNDYVQVTGNPIRAEIFQNLPTKKEALTFFGLEEGKKTILSVGGSLGSQNKNNAWKAQIEKIKTSNIQLIWQTGSRDFKSLNEDISLQVDNIKILEFIHEMKMAYVAADLIVSRAGAIAISELCLVGKPVVLLPLPWAAEDHQTKNAETLVKEGAALMIKDAVANEELVPTVLKLIQDDEGLRQMGENIKKLGKPDATTNIVDEVYKILKENKKHN
ncbi:MAG: undecaprenyldiphospho-muramoylpentapeptide beta-N-acetylglucosaminyltransferase [Flavobacteriales bacterium]